MEAAVVLALAVAVVVMDLTYMVDLVVVMVVDMVVHNPMDHLEVLEVVL